MNEQQNFWSTEYAEAYRKKNASFDLEMGIKAWAEMLKSISGITSVLEFGSNIGRNINFLNHLLPEAKKSIIELNSEAYQFVINQYNIYRSFNGPIVETDFDSESFNLTFIQGVLIHIHPDDLLANMKKIYELSSKYILIGEYFNRTPVMIEYQGEQNKLFKRDFGKMFIENFNVNLVDYGFLWGHIYDKAGFDDITWWLFEKSPQK
jgi:pseudaminic acid biosynthesis-associated methylase